MKKRLYHGQHTADFLFILSLLGVFALSALLVMLFGAGIYEKLVQQSQSMYETGTALSYVREKIHSCDSGQGISIVSKDGTDVLVLTDQVNGRMLHTCIYFLDGALLELNEPAGESLPLTAGQEILTLTDFSMQQLSDTLFHFTAVGSDRQSDEIYVTLHRS